MNLFSASAASVVFDPFVPWAVIIAAGLVALALSALAGWVRSPAWALRALGFAVLLAAVWPTSRDQRVQASLLTA